MEGVGEETVFFMIVTSITLVLSSYFFLPALIATISAFFTRASQQNQNNNNNTQNNNNNIAQNDDHPAANNNNNNDAANNNSDFLNVDDEEDDSNGPDSFEIKLKEREREIKTRIGVNWTTKRLRDKIFAQERAQRRSIRFIFQGQLLGETEVLTSCGVQEGSPILVVVGPTNSDGSQQPRAQAARPNNPPRNPTIFDAAGNEWLRLWIILGAFLFLAWMVFLRFPQYFSKFSVIALLFLTGADIYWIYNYSAQLRRPARP